MSTVNKEFLSVFLESKNICAKSSHQWAKEYPVAYIFRLRQK